MALVPIAPRARPFLLAFMWWFWTKDMADFRRLPPSELGRLVATTAVVLAGFYVIGAKICNRSRLVLSADSLELRQGPLAWPGDGHWPRAGLAGFIYTAGRLQGVTWYTVYAVFMGEGTCRIAGDLRDEDEARWLSTTLNDHLRQSRDPQGHGL